MTRICVNLACGKHGEPGWVHVDMKPQDKLGPELKGEAFVEADVRQGLPFPDEHCDVIFSEHLYEHLDMLEAKALAKESLRCLCDGGTCRTAVPDAILRPEAEAPGVMGHKCQWTAEALARLFKDAGFGEATIVQGYVAKGALRVEHEIDMASGPVRRRDSIVVDAVK